MVERIIDAAHGKMLDDRLNLMARGKIEHVSKRTNAAQRRPRDRFLPGDEAERPDVEGL